jgi:NTP pyrophosphatase (non-canonical NTP hydrolase)
MSGRTGSMNDANRFSQLIERIKQFSKDRDWSQFHDPKNLAISLQLEASEVLELFQWTKDNQAKPGKEDAIANELADVFYWLILLANHYEIDLTQALEKKMLENEAKYPVEKSKGRSDKYTDL